MKYRKRPIVIEAEQWFPCKNVDGVSYDPGQVSPATVNTLEGRMNVSYGDWIITGIEGEKYPCKDAIFKKTYEAVNGE